MGDLRCPRTLVVLARLDLIIHPDFLLENVTIVSFVSFSICILGQRYSRLPRYPRRFFFWLHLDIIDKDGRTRHCILITPKVATSTSYIILLQLRFGDYIHYTASTDSTESPHTGPGSLHYTTAS